MAEDVDKFDEALLSAESVAEMFDIGVSTVWHWVKAKRLPPPAIEKPKYTRWRKSDMTAKLSAMLTAERKEQAS